MAFGKAKADASAVQRRTMAVAQAKEQSQVNAGKALTAALACVAIVAIGAGGWAALRSQPVQQMMAGAASTISSGGNIGTTKSASYSKKAGSRKRLRPQQRREKFWNNRCKGGNGSLMCQIHKEINKGSGRRKRTKPDFSKGLW